MKPVTPAFPFFWARCGRCGHECHSLNAATDPAPFSYVCFACQDPGTREDVRIHANEQVQRFETEQPGWVAHARRALGIRRPRGTPHSQAWEGCSTEAGML